MGDSELSIEELLQTLMNLGGNLSEEKSLDNTSDSLEQVSLTEKISDDLPLFSSTIISQPRYNEADFQSFQEQLKQEKQYSTLTNQQLQEQSSLPNSDNLSQFSANNTLTNQQLQEQSSLPNSDNLSQFSANGTLADQQLQEQSSLIDQENLEEFNLDGSLIFNVLQENLLESQKSFTTTEKSENRENSALLDFLQQLESEPILPEVLPVESSQKDVKWQSYKAEKQEGTEDKFTVEVKGEMTYKSEPKPISPEAVGEDLEKLHDLISDLVMPGKKQLLAQLADQVKQIQSQLEQPDASIERMANKLESLEYKLSDPDELIKLLLPVIAELISFRVQESKSDVIEAIVPIIDQVIFQKHKQDKESMVTVLAAIIPGAISRQLALSPEEVIQSLGPAMGESIKEQIRLEKDAMVDALYPVIGNTITKYMQEVVAQINQRVESAFSLEGLKRKVKARLQGVSEAELIFKEAMPFTIRAVFLIHKGSGLIISEAQRKSIHPLESDMLAGMLTAIRSFGGECQMQENMNTELTEIQYENFKIMMEVAGYCYIAVILEGDASQHFIQKIKQVLSSIILNYGYGGIIENFQGDPESIPPSVHQLIQSLADYLPPDAVKKNRSKAPIAVSVLLLVLMSIIIIPWQIFRHQEKIARHLEDKTMVALSSTPQLAVYRLEVDVQGKTLKLKGKLPNEYLRQKALDTVTKVAPTYHIDNEIIAIETPPDPVLIEAEVQRLTQTFNQSDGVIITVSYKQFEITIQGMIRSKEEAEKIVTAYGDIPGIKKVILTFIPQPLPIDQRIYFNYGSDVPIPKDIQEKLLPIRQFLQKYPQIKLKLIGYADISGNQITNEYLAIARAKRIKMLLVQQGISENRLFTDVSQETPPHIPSQYPLWMSRCVRFEKSLTP